MKRRRNPVIFIVSGILCLLTGAMLVWMEYDSQKFRTSFQFYGSISSYKTLDLIFIVFGSFIIILGIVFIISAFVNISKNNRRMDEIKDFFYSNYNKKLVKFIEGDKSWNYGAIGIDAIDGLVIADTSVIKIEEITNVEIVKNYSQNGSVTTFNNGNNNSVGYGTYSGVSSEFATGIRIYTNNIKNPMIFVSGDHDFSYDAYSTLLAVLNKRK